MIISRSFLWLFLLYPILIAGIGIGAGGSGVVTGSIVISDGGTCPTGYAEVTAARGFYPRMMLAAGETAATTVGTVLTANENRATGAHTHTFASGAGGSAVVLLGAGASNNDDLGGQTGAVAPIIPAGTNAPYYLIRLCKKN